jgi:hypothetical protein
MPCDPPIPAPSGARGRGDRLLLHWRTGMGVLMDDRLRLMIRRQFLLLMLGMLIFVTGLALLWTEIL